MNESRWMSHDEWAKMSCQTYRSEDPLDQNESRWMSQDVMSCILIWRSFRSEWDEWVKTKESNCHVTHTAGDPKILRIQIRMRQDEWVKRIFRSVCVTWCSHVHDVLSHVTHACTHMHAHFPPYQPATKHTYIHTYLPRVHTNIPTYTRTNLFTHIHTYMLTYRPTNQKTNIQTYTHTNVHRNIHTNKHTYIHTHVHTYSLLLLPPADDCPCACVRACVHACGMCVLCVRSASREF